MERAALAITSILFALCAASLIAVCYRMWQTRWSRHWLALTVVFAALFVVKASGSFAGFEDSLRSLDTTIVQAGWQVSSTIVIVVQVLVAVALLLPFVTFVFALDPDVRRRLVLGGALFVAGAVGAEALSEWLWSVSGPASPTYVLADALEMALEACGLIVFLSGLAVQFARAGGIPVAHHELREKRTNVV